LANPAAQVSKLKGTAQKHACSAATKAGKCKYYKGVETHKQRNSDWNKNIMDIEDLGKMGKESCVCPYFLSRDAAESADIILLPYNYLLDPGIREGLLDGNLIQGNVVIFDEAHNIESVCCQAASFDLTPETVAASEQEVEKALELSSGDLDVAKRSGDSTTMGAIETDIERFKALQENVVGLRQLLAKPCTVVGGDVLIGLLGEIGITPFTQSSVSAAIERVMVKLAEVRSGGALDTTPRQAALSKVREILKVAFPLGSDPTAVQASLQRDYKLCFHQGDKKAAAGAKKARQNDFFGGDAPVEGRTLSCWCFSAGVAMTNLSLQRPKSIILTSGTLGPLSSLEMELRCDFPVKLENTHVISSDQVWAGVIKVSPSNRGLNSSFKHRESEQYKEDLGNTLTNLCRIVPDGLLVFFPSYTAMQSCLEDWRKTKTGNKESLWSRLNKFKEVCIEPRNAVDMRDEMAKFVAKVDQPNGRGAMLLAVCRGKVAEGIDFADRHGRAVVLTGIPYPSVMDEQVKLKKEYMDRVYGKAFSGDDWYKQQAMRAMNQAVGRVIRHRKDHGAVILCDERFAQPGQIKGISSWMRPHIKVQPSFGEALRSLTQFYKQAAKLFPEADRPVRKVGGGAAAAAVQSGGVGDGLGLRGQGGARGKHASASDAPLSIAYEDDGKARQQLSNNVGGKRASLKDIAMAQPAKAALAASKPARSHDLGGILPSRKSRHLLGGITSQAVASEGSRGGAWANEVSRSVKASPATLVASDPLKKSQAPKPAQTNFLDDAQKSLGISLYSQFKDILIKHKAEEITSDLMLTAALNVFTLAKDPELAGQFVKYVPTAHRDTWRGMVKGMNLPPKDLSLIGGPKQIRAEEDAKALPPAKRGCGAGGKAFPVFGKVNVTKASKDQCCVCSKRPSKPFKAKCGHVACYECWTHRVQVCNQRNCGICEAPVRMKELTQIYFSN